MDVMMPLVNLSMDKNVSDILSKSQYGQKRRCYPQLIFVWTKTQMVSIVNLSMDKNVDDILSNSQYGENVDDIHSKSQFGQKRR